MTMEARTSAIHSAVQAATDAVRSGQGPSQPLKWRGGEIILPVITIDLDLVLLNPHSHRISGQLQSLDKATQKGVADDPFGEESQAIVADVLRQTAGFDGIRNAVGRDGQLEPGVITIAGVLINANTRAVALRELRQPYIKVVVLPADATSKEIVDLELQLQMEVPVKQEYTLTSRLLFIEDLIESGRSVAEVGRALRPDLTESKAHQKVATESVQQDLRLLGIIRDVIEASGGRLTFVYFDEKKQVLVEIDEDYQKMKNTQPDEAVRVRDAQLTGLICDIGYNNMRQVDSQLLDDYVAPAMSEEIFFNGYADHLLGRASDDSFADTVEGLDVFDDLDHAAPNDSPHLGRLFKLLAASDEEDIIEIPTSDGSDPALVPRKALVANMHGVLVTAVENKLRDGKKLDDLIAPITFLKDAARAVDKAAVAYGNVSTRSGFDLAKFDQARAELGRAVDDLEAKLADDRN